MKVTKEGTTNIIKWYQPESSEECKKTDCRKCIFLKYFDTLSACPFEQYFADCLVEKPINTDPLLLELNIVSDNQVLEQMREHFSQIFKEAEEKNTLSSQPVPDALSRIDIITHQLNEIKHQLQKRQ